MESIITPPDSVQKTVLVDISYINYNWFVIEVEHVKQADVDRRPATTVHIPFN